MYIAPLCIGHMLVEQWCTGSTYREKKRNKTLKFGLEALTCFQLNIISNFKKIWSTFEINLGVSLNLCKLHFIQVTNSVVVCKDGTYGNSCVYNCSGNCLNDFPCNRQTGQCDMGCKPGYINAFCNER